MHPTVTLQEPPPTHSEASLHNQRERVKIRRTEAVNKKRKGREDKAFTERPWWSGRSFLQRKFMEDLYKRTYVKIPSIPCLQTFIQR